MPVSLVNDMQAGEHKHHILQALCRSRLRQGNGSECGHCNAYIIAPARSKIAELLPEVFPGCKLSTWKQVKPKARGKVYDALTHVELFFEDDPFGVLTFVELRNVLGYEASNFRNRIRKHDSFKAGLKELGVEEVILGSGRFCNAFARQVQTFGSLEGATYIANV